ncbi:hypothetical protein BASA81_012901 [Batrachochytrium salamandrivorans]|nr:hypothetical protein BASA81_012901 [Batrachochytrium salamandrivorans]
MLRWCCWLLVVVVVLAQAGKTRYPTIFPTLATSSPSASPTASPTADTKGGFKIRFLYTGSFSPAVIEAFESAAARWKQIITTGYLSPFTIPKKTVCEYKFNRKWVVAADLLIIVKLKRIDGRGNALGDAMPCVVDQFDHIRVGLMEFDSADVGDMVQRGLFQSIVLHEMGHVLGLGTRWNKLKLITQQRSPFGGFEYLGKQGNVGNQEVGRTGSAVVEDMGDSGTARAHWKEDFYDAELMTGYVEESGTPMPLSRLTVRALQDLGYQVDVTKADEYKAPNLELGNRLRKTKISLQGCGGSNRTVELVRSRPVLL